MAGRGFGWRYWYWPRGWWCPRHPWPPAWARPYYPWHGYPTDPAEELKLLEDIRKDIQRELSDLERRIDELRRRIEEKK